MITQFATEATQKGAAQTQFSVVSFATDATIRATLTSANDATSVIDGLAYTGGWTNTEDALQKCQDTLPNTDPTTKNVILLFTDGTPTKCTQTSSDIGAQGGGAKCFGTYCLWRDRRGQCRRYAENFCGNTIDWFSGTTTPWKDDVCAKYADTAATTIERFGTTIATLFVKTTDDCPNPGQGRCYPGSQFLKDQIATNTGLAQEANWDDVTALVGTMADQIVAGIC